MTGFVRFCVCVLFLVASALVIAVPKPVQAASFIGQRNLGPVPRGLPRPEEISFPKQYAPGTIVVVTAHRRLYYVTRRGRALRYVVGVGRRGMTWRGNAQVAKKREWPKWIPPQEMRARARAKGKFLPQELDGGPNNPLGARALYLYKNGKDTLYRIHGTNEPHNLGKAVTSGCIRMLNHHVADLYSRVKLGTQVIVR